MITTEIESSSPSSLQARYSALQSEQPKLRIRDAASQLNVSEAELVALGCGQSAKRLNVTDWPTFVSELKALGHVMLLTRNESCVHERSGHYEEISAHGSTIGLVTGKDIDLRLFYKGWTSAFAVTVPWREGKTLQSLQVFDAAGDAIHKIYLKEDGDQGAYDALVAKYLSDDQCTDQVVGERSGPTEVPAELDAAGKEAFVKSWSELKDTHDYFILLKKHKVSRLQAMAYAEGHFTKKVGADSAKRVLELASERDLSIMVFVGNDHAIQIHTGPTKNIVEHGDWINVIDPTFSLHLNQTGIASSWIVEKPTVDGTVTSLEVYDKDGEMIVQFFGARKPGIPEREDWRQLVADIK